MQFRKASIKDDKETCAFYIDAVCKRVLERKAKELGHPQSKLVNDIFRHVFAKDIAKISSKSSKTRNE